MNTFAVSVSAEQLALINGYNKAHYSKTYVIHTPPESTIGGFSAEFVDFTDKNEDEIKAILRMANNDKFTAPMSEITVNISF